MSGGGRPVPMPSATDQSSLLVRGPLHRLPASHRAAGRNLPVPSEPVFTGLQVDGRTLTGRIVAIDPDRVILASEENAKEELPFRSLVKLTRELRSSPPVPEGSHRALPGGDRLMRVIVGATTDTALEVQSHSALGKLAIPLDASSGSCSRRRTRPRRSTRCWEQVRGEPQVDGRHLAGQRRPIDGGIPRPGRSRRQVPGRGEGRRDRSDRRPRAGLRPRGRPTIHVRRGTSWN